MEEDCSPSRWQDDRGKVTFMVQGTGVAESLPRPVKVGVYFDLRNPAQWRQGPARLYGFTVEACEESERLGADSIWFSEHHLFDDDYLASPLTFAAAAAARTNRVRLGTAIVIAPLRHPAELAEQCGVVDLVSNGRLDLGLGAGYRVLEFDLYDTTLDRKYGRTDDTARRLRELWGPGGVRPGPVQSQVPIEMVYLWASIGGMSEEMVMRNINSICTRVKPLLKVTERAVT
jgi:alkanesulfonate monooxygenase SsuD/methylene tetrahydromethanopterin reductase-like flavin-dependent oxidoreductase (luciferase family)